MEWSERLFRDLEEPDFGYPTLDDYSAALATLMSAPALFTVPETPIPTAATHSKPTGTVTWLIACALFHLETGLGVGLPDSWLKKKEEWLG